MLWHQRGSQWWSLTLNVLTHTVFFSKDTEAVKIWCIAVGIDPIISGEWLSY